MRRAFFICSAGDRKKSGSGQGAGGRNQPAQARRTRTDTRRQAGSLDGAPATDSIGLRSSHWIPVFTAMRPGHACPGRVPKRPRQPELGGMPAEHAGNPAQRSRGDRYQGPESSGIRQRSGGQTASNPETRCAPLVHTETIPWCSGSFPSRTTILRCFLRLHASGLQPAARQVCREKSLACRAIHVQAVV